jgi:hypothetical protein
VVHTKALTFIWKRNLVCLLAKIVTLVVYYTDSNAHKVKAFYIDYPAANKHVVVAGTVKGTIYLY